MDRLKRILCFANTREEGRLPPFAIASKKERVSWFQENGGELLEGLVTASGGRYDVPYRNFTAKELIAATTSFKDCVLWDGTGDFYRGSFQERDIIVKIYRNWILSWGLPWGPYFINDFVISLQMSRHKNVCKILGCCLEFETIALVYELDTPNPRLLSDVLTEDVDSVLPWRVRLKLAVDIGNALVYLHSELATPVIHRDLCARNVLVGSGGVAKLLDFSLCVALPPGESQVEDRVIGVTGLGEPEYMMTGIITEKTDVYKFGLLLLELLTGEKPVDIASWIYLRDEGLDAILSRVKIGNREEYEQQLRAFAGLALRCTRPDGNDRPEMITVAKELVRIKKSLHPSLV